MIHWYINEAQADYIFRCLGTRPWVEVNALMNDLHAQANPPREPANPAPPAVWQASDGAIPEPPVPLP
jgi:hypothetical protein